MTTEELLEGYTTYLHALNRRPKTIATHRTRNLRFFGWAASRNIRHPSEVLPRHITDYQKHVATILSEDGRPYSVMVRNQHLAAVAGFFRWLRRDGHLAHNPTADLEYARVPDRMPRSVLSVQDMRKLLRQPDTSTVIGFRDRCIMETFYSTAIRRAELIALDLEDLNLDTGFLMIREGKGAKDRVVPLGKVAGRFLESYLNAIRPELLRYAPDPNTGALFLSLRGKRMSRSVLNSMIPKYARQAKLTIPVSPHTFRHSCATHMIRNQAGVRHVQAILGHRHLVSTQQYIRLTANDLKAAHEKYHPRDR